MEVDWVIAGVKTGVIALSGVVATHYRKPFYNWIKAQIKLNNEYLKLKSRVDELEGKMFVIDCKRKAGIHTDKQPTFKVNTKGDLIYVNPAWSELFEYDDPENAYGLRFMDIIHPDDYERVKAIHRDTINSPSGFNDPVKFRTRKTKKTINTICVTDLLHDKTGVLIGIMGRLHVLDSS